MGNETPEEILKNVLTEKELSEFLGMNKRQIGDLRAKGLPFIKLSTTARLYFERDLVQFFKQKRITLDQG
jgi:hypothetical protein